MKGIYISADAFWSVTLAAIEVYDKECFGFLVGYELADRWIVQRAITHQTARRYLTWVQPLERSRRRIESAIRSLSLGESTLGWFHSHPGSGGGLAVPTLSDDDVRYAKEGDVMLVLAMRGRKRRVKWGHNRNGSISGTLGDYHLTLAAFTKTSRGTVRRLSVYCSYAHGFNPD